MKISVVEVTVRLTVLHADDADTSELTDDMDYKFEPVDSDLPEVQDSSIIGAEVLSTVDVLELGR